MNSCVVMMQRCAKCATFCGVVIHTTWACCGGKMRGCVLPVDHDLAVATGIAYAAAGDCGITYAYAGLIVRAVCATG